MSSGELSNVADFPQAAVTIPAIAWQKCVDGDFMFRMSWGAAEEYGVNPHMSVDADPQMIHTGTRSDVVGQPGMNITVVSQSEVQITKKALLPVDHLPSIIKDVWHNADSDRVDALMAFPVNRRTKPPLQRNYLRDIAFGNTTDWRRQAQQLDRAEFPYMLAKHITELSAVVAAYGFLDYIDANERTLFDKEGQQTTAQGVYITRIRNLVHKLLLGEPYPLEERAA